MAKLSEVFPSKYLKADEIPDEGMIVTISRVEIEKLGQGKEIEVKPVLYFEEEDKGLVCNKTNSGTLVKLTKSDDTDDWVGHKIRLLAVEVQFKDEMVNAIRISTKPVKAAAAKKPAAPEPEEESDQDIPF